MYKIVECTEIGLPQVVVTGTAAEAVPWRDEQLNEEDEENRDDEDDMDLDVM